MDRLTVQQRHQNMSAIRSKDTETLGTGGCLAKMEEGRRLMEEARWKMYEG